jgi:hypothetical protein
MAEHTNVFVSEACFEDVCDECDIDGCWCECHEEDDDGV